MSELEETLMLLIRDAGLPEPERQYKISFNGKNLVDEAIHYSSFDSGCPCWFFNGFARHKGEGEYEEFTHWRPLPEAPKEVKE